MATPTWYLLFEGTSVDGRGQASYKCRTDVLAIAEAHKRRISKNPYNTGYVVVVTDTTYTRL